VKSSVTARCDTNLSDATDSYCRLLVEFSFSTEGVCL